MNQIHRIGLGVAGVAAVITVAGALVVDGYVTANQNLARAAASQQDPSAITTVEPTASQTLSGDPITIYVRPAPIPPVTNVTTPAPVVTSRPVAPAPAVTPPVIHVVVPTPRGEGGGTDD
jgi:hypothetical protein